MKLCDPIKARADFFRNRYTDIELIGWALRIQREIDARPEFYEKLWRVLYPEPAPDPDVEIVNFPPVEYPARPQFMHWRGLPQYDHLDPFWYNRRGRGIFLPDGREFGPIWCMEEGPDEPPSTGEYLHLGIPLPRPSKRGRRSKVRAQYVA